MKKLSLALILIMACAMTAQAGETAFGIKGGLTMATLTGDDTDDLNSKTGFMIGGYAEFPMSPTFSIQPEAYYSQKGAKYTEENVDVNINLNYLDIPVLAKYTFPSEKTKFFLLAGPSLGFKLSSSLSAEGQSVDLDDVTSTDFGLVFGLGVNMQKFLIEGRYNLGLSNIDSHPESTSSIKNAVWNILLGYAF